MCSQLLEDIVRITVDRRKGRNAIDTGNFELIYKQVTTKNLELSIIFSNYLQDAIWNDVKNLIYVKKN